MKVAIYLRKSRADIEAEARGEGDALARHRRTLLDLAKDRGYYVADIKEEIASGERIAARPKMQELLEEVERGEYDAVLCMDLDRLGRGTMREQGLILDLFRETKTKIITPRKEYDLSDEIDEELSEIQAFFARKEFKMITRRLMAGRRASLREGNWIYGNAPYGYQLWKDEKGHTLRPDPNEAPIAQKIFEWYVEEGIGAYRIAHRLSEMGIPSRTGGTWAVNTVRGILRNALAYAGYIYIGRKKRTRPLDAETVPGRHPALISEKIARRALERLKRRETPPKRKDRKLKNPLAGLVHCADCGRCMIRKAYSPKKIYLACDYCPNNWGAPLAVVEAELIAALREWLDQYKVKIEPEKKESANILPSLQKQKAAAEQQKARLHDLLEQGVYDIDTFLTRSKILTDRIEKLEAAIKEAQQKEKQIDIIPRIEKILDGYETASPEQRNALLKAILEKVIYEKRERYGQVKLKVYPRL